MRLDLDTLYERAIAIADFISVHYPRDFFIAQARDALEVAHKNKKARALRDVVTVLTELATSLPVHEFTELNRLFESRFGVSVSLSALLRPDVDAIRTRGRIGNANEYRAVLAYVDEIVAAPKNESDVEALNRLLAAYDSKVEEVRRKRRPAG